MPCPSAEALAALYDCVLPREQATRLRDHVARCPRCAADVRTLGQLLDCPEAGLAPSAEQRMKFAGLADRPADPHPSERQSPSDEADIAPPPAKSLSPNK